jgi:hypothetical protein
VHPLRGPHRLLGLVQHLLGGFPKGPACVRKLHASLGALEEWHPQLVFELTNLLAERGLRDVQARRRPAKVEFFRDDQEVTQMAKFHSNSFYDLVTPIFYIGRHHTWAASLWQGSSSQVH